MNIQAREMLRWDDLDTGKFADETASVRDLAAATGLDEDAQARIRETAIALVTTARKTVKARGLMDSFLQEMAPGPSIWAGPKAGS